MNPGMSTCKSKLSNYSLGGQVRKNHGDHKLPLSDGKIRCPGQLIKSSCKRHGIATDKRGIHKIFFLFLDKNICCGVLIRSASLRHF